MAANSPENLGLESDVSPWTTSLLYPLGSRIVLPLYFDSIRVVGQENLPDDGPLLIAPTHRSRWDGLVVGHCLGHPATGRDLRYMVSVNEMSGLQGWLIRQFGGFSVDPDAPSVAALRHGVDLLLNDGTLVIFGEGDIFYKRTVDYIKPGLARIALQAQKKAVRQCSDTPVRILPVGLYYSEIRPTRGSSVEIRFGSTLNVKNYLNVSTKQAAAQITNDLTTSLNQLMTLEAAIDLPRVSAQAL